MDRMDRMDRVDRLGPTRILGEFVGDVLVEKTVIVELKSVKQTSTAHEAQLVNYLVATGKPIGLLLNFGEKKVHVKRKVRELTVA